MQQNSDLDPIMEEDQTQIIKFYDFPPDNAATTQSNFTHPTVDKPACTIESVENDHATTLDNVACAQKYLTCDQYMMPKYLNTQVEPVAKGQVQPDDDLPEKKEENERRNLQIWDRKLRMMMVYKMKEEIDNNYLQLLNSIQLEVGKIDPRLVIKVP